MFYFWKILKQISHTSPVFNLIHLFFVLLTLQFTFPFHVYEKQTWFPWTECLQCKIKTMNIRVWLCKEQLPWFSLVSVSQNVTRAYFLWQFCAFVWHHLKFMLLEIIIIWGHKGRQLSSNNIYVYLSFQSFSFRWNNDDNILCYLVLPNVAKIVRP